MLDFLRRSFGPMEQPDPGGWRARQAGALERTQTRAIDSFTNHPGLTEQLLAVQGLHNRPWRVASLREAMGVPSNFRAITLISNTVGSLAMEAYRKGVLLDSEDTPRIVQRPIRSASLGTSTATPRSTSRPAGSSGGGSPRAMPTTRRCR